ncbi:hypothetical protein COU23_00520 [Candidatus Kuenenbacteria bacterium CG10_big_fil_rev_8_21_14_0_10_36_11]|uniref:Uncharacterized protein n=1 Tax=Candidatus Kuenenbacteria bacterium CG10_big_fil_rev_8_21_14_0_10_36_11 TaxID=1974618 RepID=A0A2M6WBA8_9BACT|nr:MAG: hypothetical protein COU23_00520 [Candidatus Kuenenbacteria bacterium CG10_big_fil_rev_8_21_14_0_10_36_11]
MNNESQTQWYYKIVYFFIANQVLFKRLAVVLLILINIALFWFAGVRLVNYSADTKNYQQILTELTALDTSLEKYRDTHKPFDLEIISVDKISLGDNKYDLVAKLSNPNLNWLADLQYAFIVDGLMLDWQSTFILPGESKYFFKFNYYSLNYPVSMELKLGANNWQRIKAKDLSRVLQEIVIGEPESLAQNNYTEIKFSAENLSHFNFWQVGWQVVAYNGAYPVAINYVTIDKFLSGQKRTVSAAWNYNFGVPSKIEIIPDINIYNDKNYFKSDAPAVNLIRGARDEK